MQKIKKIDLDKEEIVLGTNPKTNEKITDKIYGQYVKEKNKTTISEMIFHRLNGRYLRPFTYKDKIFIKKYKNGFSIMANCCLCIEVFQSFKNGWDKIPKGGDRVFDDFFNEYSGLNEFSGKKFYKHIRCGILHQGETIGGWRIRRDGDLLNKKMINSVKFLEHLQYALEEYRKELESSGWNSTIWINCRKKIGFILKNCEQ
ncbi:MAG: hypothetical protein G01um101449_207 [Parcubacteria group bacterium Gr01-1014_49]|nr:MAG: hypothetical protein G01um101449_207 [Parcubacteria group bacterium Gr01-1014_49]